VALDKTGRGDEALRELQDMFSLGKEFDGAEDARALMRKLSKK